MMRRGEAKAGNAMLQEITERHAHDQDGNPTGGQTTAVGLMIDWQDGPLGRGEDRQEPNGAFVETVIVAAMGRLQFYQKSKFACNENEAAIASLKQAMASLNRRTEKREAAGVEGTHQTAAETMSDASAKAESWHGAPKG